MPGLKERWKDLDRVPLLVSGTFSVASVGAFLCLVCPYLPITQPVSCSDTLCPVPSSSSGTDGPAWKNTWLDSAHSPILTNMEGSPFREEKGWGHPCPHDSGPP